MALPETDVALVERFGFLKFVELAWHQIEATPFVFEPHIRLVCEHYEAVARGEIRDLVINVPPGTSKSTVSSVLYPAWDWIKNPWRKFMFVSYDEKLSHSFAKRSMKLMQSEWFQARWPHVQIEGGERAPVGLFTNDKGGVRFSTMMGGAATGRHAHVLLVDDPHKPDDLSAGGESAKAALDEAWTRWTETFSRRVADASTFARVCIMQRLHEEDLAGRMLKGSNVVHLRLPMEFESRHAYTSRWGSDWRKEEGQLLCPIRFPADYLFEQKHGATGLTPRAWAAQMQQRPAPEAGTLFRREWMTQRWTNTPTGMRTVLSVDATLKNSTDSDYCVGQVWGLKGGTFFLLDSFRERASFSEAVSMIKAMKKRWAHVGQIIIEDKANGTAIVDTLRAQMPGVLAVSPLGGKIARANAVEPYWRSMSVWLPPDRPWVPGFVEELASFPVGAYDDQVDCMSQAMLFLLGRNVKSGLGAAMSRVRAGGFRLPSPRR